MTESDAQVLDRLLKNVFSERIKTAVVSLLRDDLPEKDLFSGTLFRLGGRLFVITCAHELPANPNRKVWVVRKSGSLRSQGFPGFRSSKVFPGKWPDVGVLEMDAAILDTYLSGYRPIEWDDVGSLDYSVHSHSMVSLVGNVSEQAHVARLGEGYAFGASIVCLLHDVVHPSKWPTPMSEDHPNDPAIDIYVRSVKQHEAEPGNRDTYYAAPYGLSGGGLWVVQGNRGELITPSSFKLVGVQAEWNYRDGFLRAVRIEKVRELLHLGQAE